MTPKTLGRYEIVDLIGQGGMGVLYRARDPWIGRFVAVKLLRRGYDTPEFRDRFSQEARAAGRLSHPNIVTIYDVGEYDGLPFIAMEYVRGETFADLARLRPPLSVERKLQLIEEVCAGLAHAHEAGIVHRDIKPMNLIVGPEGTVKILDFGIAKLNTSGLTLPGSILGTMNYMSPEQVKGGSVDARADIFAVGAVLYELLSHQLAFPGEVQGEVLHQIVTGEPTPITAFCPDLDPRLVQLVYRALEKDPARRFQTIAQVQKELLAIRLSQTDRDFPAAGSGTASESQAVGKRSLDTRPADKSADEAARELARRRTRQIEEHLKGAEGAFASGDFDAAIESCKQVLLLDASEERAVSQIARIHAAIDEQQVQRHLAEARRQLSRKDTAAAWEALDAAASLLPDHPEIAKARNDVLAEKARIRATATRMRIDRAKATLDQGDLDQALRETGQALALDPENAELQALKKMIESKIKDQRLEQEKAEQRERITALLGDVRLALNDRRIDDALRALDAVRELDVDGSVPELPDLTKRVQRAQRAARRKIEVDRLLVDFDEQLRRGELRRAGDLLNAAMSLIPTDRRVQEARERFEQAMAPPHSRTAARPKSGGKQGSDDSTVGLDTPKPSRPPK